MNDFWNATYQVARKEFLQHIRTKRLLIIMGLLILFMVLFLFVFGPNFVRGVGFGGSGMSRQHLVLSFYFAPMLVGGLQFMQLLAIVLTMDAVCSEWNQKTIFLLLSKPVPRTAFVTGKYLGNLATIAASLVPLFLLAYVALIPAYSGAPSGCEFVAFLTVLAFILLGCAAFASISLFVSTITKTTLMSALIVMAMWIIGFPMISNIGVFTADGPFARDDWALDGWRYLSPGAAMQAGIKLMAVDEGGRDILDGLDFFNVFNFAAQRVWLAALSLAGFTGVFFLASIIAVQLRNFE